MRRLSALAAVLITASSAPAAAQVVLGPDDFIDQTSESVPKEPDIVPPITQSAWMEMTDRVKIIYSSITIEMLQRGHSYKGCLPSDPVLFVSALDRAVSESENEGPLLLPVALVARAFCTGA